MKLKLLLATLLNVSISFAQVPNYVPTNGLVGWWPFNGNANDESANNNNGIINGPVLTTDRDGNANSAYDFNGTTDFIEVADNVSLSFGSNQITISLWVNIAGYSGISRIGVSKQSGSGNTQSGFNVFYKSGAHGMLARNGSGGVFGGASNTQGIPTSTWTHVVYVWDGNTGSCYENGVMVNSSVYAGAIIGSNSLPLLFGKANWTYNNVEPYGGKLDDIAIYNRPLNDCEIQDLYHAQLNSSIVDAGIDQTICSGESVTLTASNSMNYSWNNNVVDGSPFTPNATSSYVVTADTAGCTSTDSLTVTVNETTTSTIDVTATDTYTSPSGVVYDSSGVYIDTILNANQCDSIITINLTVEYTGINELEKTEVSIYPNPTSEILSISGLEKLNGIYGYKIASISGTVISEIKGQSKHVNVSGLSKGIYFLNIMHEEGIETVQFIKK